jgi:hypothetical protein
VDYALWPDTPSLERFTATFDDLPESIVNEWRLFPGTVTKTGTTIEWLEDEKARFYWTYDEHLVSGNAEREGGEPDRLNDWWRTTGALMRERP